MTPEPGRYNVEQYFSLFECGIISPDERVELLDGLIVAMAPSTPPHDGSVTRVQYALQRKLGLDVVIRVQMSFIATGSESVPEPDIAVVPGSIADYDQRHPSTAHLIVEVSASSLVQDRLTKAAIYARAGVPCYWILNVRDRWIEAHRQPDRWKGVYLETVRVRPPERLRIDAFPDVDFEASELIAPYAAYRA